MPSRPATPRLASACVPCAAIAIALLPAGCRCGDAAEVTVVVPPSPAPVAQSTPAAARPARRPLPDSREPDPIRGEYIRAHYAKFEYRIPMRDGVRLFTAVYVPNDASDAKRYPIMMQRTPYGVAPYGLDRYPDRIGPTEA